MCCKSDRGSPARTITNKKPLPERSAGKGAYVTSNLLPGYLRCLEFAQCAAPTFFEVEVVGFIGKTVANELIENPFLAVLLCLNADSSLACFLKHLQHRGYLLILNGLLFS